MVDCWHLAGMTQECGVEAGRGGGGQGPVEPRCAFWAFASMCLLRFHLAMIPPPLLTVGLTVGLTVRSTVRSTVLW